MISSSEGVAPEAMNSVMVEPACLMSSNSATPVSGGGIAGMRSKTISTTTPSDPSEPTNRLARSKPATPLAVGRPRVVSEPSASTTVSCRT
jgi:hypothetical protein